MSNVQIGTVISMYTAIMNDLVVLGKCVGVSKKTIQRSESPCVRLFVTCSKNWYNTPDRIGAYYPAWFRSLLHLLYVQYLGCDERRRDRKIQRYINASVPPQHVNACRQLHYAFMRTRESKSNRDKLYDILFEWRSAGIIGCGDNLSRHFSMLSGAETTVARGIKRIMINLLHLHVHSLPFKTVSTKNNLFVEAINFSNSCYPRRFIRECISTVYLLACNSGYVWS